MLGWIWFRLGYAIRLSNFELLALVKLAGIRNQSGKLYVPTKEYAIITCAPRVENGPEQLSG